GEGEAVAAGVQLAGEVAVLGEDRAEEREAVVGGVRREEEDQSGGRGQDHEQDAAVPEDRLRDLGDHRVLYVVGAEGDTVVDQVLGRVLGQLDVSGRGEGDDPAEHGDGQEAHHGERGGGVARLGLAKGGDAVGDRLDTGERR